MIQAISVIVAAILSVLNEILKRSAPESIAKKRVEDAKKNWDDFYKKEMARRNNR